MRTLPRLLLLAAGVAALPARAQDSSAYSSEQGTFALADGFDSNLFASEADGVEKPLQIRFDARGRLWVACGAGYPHPEPGAEPDDRIVLLEDSNRDGRADRSTVFARGLFLPLGLEVLADGSGCYVAAGGELRLLRDRDGDGRSDSSETLLRGFGLDATLHTVNTLEFSPLGELCFSQGALARARVETPAGLVRLDGAGLWRFDPRTHRLHAWPCPTPGPANPRAQHFDAWGGLVVLDAGEGFHLDPLAARARHPAPAERLGDGRRALSGAARVETAHFPPEWQDRLLASSYLDHTVAAFQVGREGDRLLFEETTPLLVSTHDSFRPVDLRFGPDGALYVCDWFNPILGHDPATFRHPDRNRDHGRIWRFTARQREPTPVRDLAKESPVALCGLLDSPDGWTRGFARRLLAEGREDETREPVLALARNPPSDLALVQALAILHAQGALPPTHPGLERLRASPDPRARAFLADLLHAIRPPLPETAALLQTLLQDPHPRVRLHAQATGIP